jgi:prepilin-type N-terminal cleavage/methylation domain-containing protein
MPAKNNNRMGFTLIELMITILAAAILMLGITGILAAGHKNFRTMFRRTSQGVVPDAYVARRAFDTFVRKASIKRYDPSDADITPSNYLYVYYYSNPQILIMEEPDCYAHFYLNGTQLMLELGTVTGNFGAYPGLPSLSSPTTTLILAKDVASVNFKVFMYSVKMSLILDNENIPGSTNKLETLRMTVTSTAILHNDWY